MNKIESFRGEYAFLSNFYPATVELEGICFPTIENAFQAAKVMGAARKKFLNVTPGQAKALGRKVTRRTDWFSVNLFIMEDLVRQKFKNSPELKKLLLATGGAEIIEGNNWNDTFYGVCRGVGRNELGKIIMKVRGELSE